MEGPVSAMAPVTIFCDGSVTAPRLSHPEGIAVHPDGSVWCGGELGQIYRIAPDGSQREVVASTDGFCLGMAFDARANLFVCDLAHAAVFRLEAATGKLDRFAHGADGRRFVAPNYPAFDTAGRLYVSDSGSSERPGPGIYRFAPDGAGELWHPGPFHFANGMAFNADASVLYLAETWAHRILAIDIDPDGRPGGGRELAALGSMLPDGLAVGADGSVYISCYEPSRILRVAPDGTIQTVADDPTAHELCHPTNIAFAGEALLAANLGRWHISRVEVGRRGLPLPRRA